MTSMQTTVSTWPEQRAAALHRLVACRLLAEPERLDIARANLARWEVSASPRSRPYLIEWKRLVEEGAKACAEVLNDTREETQALRSCGPFAGVVSEAERLAVIIATRPPRAAS